MLDVCSTLFFSLQVQKLESFGNVIIVPQIFMLVETWGDKNVEALGYKFSFSLFKSENRKVSGMSSLQA